MSPEAIYRTLDLHNGHTMVGLTQWLDSSFPWGHVLGASMVNGHGPNYCLQAIIVLIVDLSDLI